MDARRYLRHGQEGGGIQLRNYGGRVHIKDNIFDVDKGPYPDEKMASTKININLLRWLFQISWIIIRAIWLFSALSLYVET